MSLDRIDPDLLKQIPNLPIEEQKEILSLLEELEKAEKKELAKDSFLGFTKTVWPAFIEGRPTRSWQTPLSGLPEVN